MSRVLLDNNLDHRFASLLSGHEVTHCRSLGWRGLRNGELIAASELEGFDVLITGDKNLRYQQNLTGRRISIVTLNSVFITLRHIAPLVPKILRELAVLDPGSFVIVEED